MICLSKYDIYIKEYIKEKIDGDILVCVKSDMSNETSYGEVWAFADSKKVYIAEGYEKDGVWHETGFAGYGYDEAEKFYIDTFVSTGVLIGVFDGVDFELMSFSNRAARRMGHFANYLNKLKNGETIEEIKDQPEQREEKIKSGALLMRVLGYGSRYKWMLAVTFIGIAAGVALNIILPQLTNRMLFDEVLNISSQHYGKLVPLILSIAIVQLMIFGVSVFNGRFGARLSARIIYDLKMDLFTAMQNLSLSFYNRKHTGNLMTRVNNDAQDIQYFLNDGLPHFLMNLLNIAGILAIMMSVSPLLAAAVFIPVPLIIWIIRKMMPKFKKYKWNVWRKRSSINSLINDVLNGMRVVKAFGREESEKERFDTINKQMYDASVKEGIAGARTFPVMSYLMTFGGLFVWGIGGSAVVSGDMTFGMLTTFVSYITMIYGPLDFMMRVFDWYTDCMNSASRIFEVIDSRPEITEAQNPVPMKNMTGNITIKNVTFEYEPNKPVLHNISLDIKAGEMIGMVGHSGAGKSTISNLITRLYDVSEGEIMIDGINIKDISVKDLRSHIGMVLQETFLFAGTVAENIAFAKPDATREEIIAAAKSANAHDFIMKMSDGYDTPIGGSKNRLSGGEKQRISIARAILVDPRILILDEATASVDTKTERMISRAMDELVKGRTTIAIAHRLSTLKNADRIVTVDHGTIAETGTHDELVKNKGIYYNMLTAQQEALKFKEIEYDG